MNTTVAVASHSFWCSTCNSMWISQGGISCVCDDRWTWMIMNDVTEEIQITEMCPEYGVRTHADASRALPAFLKSEVFHGTA